MKEVQNLSVYVNSRSFTQNYWVALGVILLTASGGILAWLACWYKKCRENRESSYSYTALNSAPNVQDRLEMETKCCERACGVCARYLESNPRYELVDRLDDIGSRVDKHWFVVRDSSVKTERLLTVTPRAAKCPIRCDSETRSVILDLFLALQHPYIYPVLDINFRDIGGSVFIFTVLPLNENGSLKDFIYKSRWRDNWRNKYFRRGSGLPVSQVQRLGKQILEALLFLREKGFPACEHFHTGNIVVQNGAARITGLENALLGYDSRISPVVVARGVGREPANLSSLCFGHVLFEMSAGYELDGPQLSPRNYSDVGSQARVIEVLEFIFDHPEGRVPGIEELLLCDFFRNIDLREITNQCQSTKFLKTNLTSKALDLLNAVKKMQNGKRKFFEEKKLYEENFLLDKSISGGNSEDDVSEIDYDADANLELENPRKQEHRSLKVHANACDRVFISFRRNRDDFPIESQ